MGSRIVKVNEKREIRRSEGGEQGKVKGKREEGKFIRGKGSRTYKGKVKTVRRNQGW